MVEKFKRLLSFSGEVSYPVFFFVDILRLQFLFVLSCRCPDEGKIGDKMIYASTKDTIKKTFSGLGIEFQCNDRGDLDYTTLSAEVEKKA